MSILNAFTDEDKARVNAAYVLGEVKQIALSITGASTLENLQSLGWAICDGTTPVSQGITDPIIETTPDLQDKFIKMSDDETSGTTGGESEHTLITAEMPEHTHDVECSLAAGTAANARCGGVNGEFLTTSSTGSGNAHNNEPQFYELAFFIRVK